MKVKKFDEFQTPKPYNQSKLYQYGDKIELETHFLDRPGITGQYKKLSKYEILDKANNRVIKCNLKDTKSISSIFKGFKQVYRIISNNFFGGENAEKLVQYYYARGPTNLYTDLKYCIAKLERRAKQKFEYVLVLQFDSATGLPIYDCWLKTSDNTPININQAMVEDCWSYGPVEIIDLTKSIIEERAKYFISKTHTSFDKFPVHSKLYRTSRGIEKVQPKILDYEEAQKLVTGYDRTFCSTKALVDDVYGQSITIQQTSYESYQLKKKCLKLNVTMRNKKFKIKGEKLYE